MDWEGRSHRGYYFWVRGLGIDRWVYSIGKLATGSTYTTPPLEETVGAEEFETKDAAEQAARQEIDRDIALQRANSPDTTPPRQSHLIGGEAGEAAKGIRNPTERA